MAMTSNIYQLVIYVEIKLCTDILSDTSDQFMT